MAGGLGAAALAFGKVFGAHQQGALAGKQRAREDAAAAAAEARELESRKLDELIKMDALKTSAVQREKVQRESSPDWIAEAQRRQEALIRHRAQTEAEFRAPPTPPAPRGPVPGTPGHYEMIRREAQIRAENAPERLPKPPTAEQQKAGYFYRRAKPANELLSTFDDPTVLNTIAGKAGMLGNWAKTPEGQQLEQAALNWIMTVLRPDTGANMPDSERENYYKAYIPIPGDSPAVLAQKKQARADVIQSLGEYAGAAANGGAQPVRIGGTPTSAAPSKPGVPPVAPNPWRP